MNIDIYQTSSPTAFVMVETGVDPKTKMPALLHRTLALSLWKKEKPLYPPPERGEPIAYDPGKVSADIAHQGYHLVGAKVTSETSL